MKWYKPDTRWEIWDITSKEQFAEKFVVEGKFHSQVPKDIAEAFETVTYLMAHAYFYYPIYDDAMNKALLIMEMAVKLKAEQLNIDLKTPPNKKRVVYDKKLFQIIDEVCEHSHLSFLKPEFLRVKKIRNSRMHPKKHTVMGAMGFTNGNAMLFINLINKLFLQKETLLSIAEKEQELRNQIQRFRDGKFILHFENKSILVWKIYDIKYFKNQERDFYCIYIGYVNTQLENEVKNHQTNPLVIILTEFHIYEEGFKGLDLRGEQVELYKNRDIRNEVHFEGYHNTKKKLSFNDLSFHLRESERWVLWRYEELMYKNCWN